MTDPRDFDRRMDMGRADLGRTDMDGLLEMEHRMGAPTPWGWIAGAVFVIVMLALVFAGSERTRTANNEGSPPAATTTAPPAIAVPPAETTGRGGQRGQ
jgi:hypothetical protein